MVTTLVVPNVDLEDLQKQADLLSRKRGEIPGLTEDEQELLDGLMNFLDVALALAARD